MQPPNYGIEDMPRLRHGHIRDRAHAAGGLPSRVRPRHRPREGDGRRMLRGRLRHGIDTRGTPGGHEQGPCHRQDGGGPRRRDRGRHPQIRPRRRMEVHHPHAGGHEDSRDHDQRLGRDRGRGRPVHPAEQEPHGPRSGGRRPRDRRGRRGHNGHRGPSSVRGWPR